METALKIRGWILGDGRSIRAVARETGISRKTIKKYLKDPEQPQYRGRQPRVGHKLSAESEARLRELFKRDLQLRYCTVRSGNSLAGGAMSPCRGAPRQGLPILVFHGVAHQPWRRANGQTKGYGG